MKKLPLEKVSSLVVIIITSINFFYSIGFSTGLRSVNSPDIKNISLVNDYILNLYPWAVLILPLVILSLKYIRFSLALTLLLICQLLF